MKKVVAIIGSPRMGDTVNTVRLFEEKLKAICETEFECIHLKDMDIQPCRGCLACVAKGEDHCPLKDDTAEIMRKLLSADGIVFATPVYSLQISGQLKLFIDRIAYLFHRPCLFDKAFIAITVQAINGYKDAHAYLNKIAHVWGLAMVPGLALNTPPGLRSAELQAENIKKAEKAAKDFYTALCGGRLKTPNWKDFILFRMTRSFMPFYSFMARDCEYYREKGWMESDYYYPVRLWFVKKWAGRFFDVQGRKLGERLRAKRAKEMQA
jgi:multimeric flavodoxin WrbA